MTDINFAFARTGKGGRDEERTGYGISKIEGGISSELHGHVHILNERGVGDAWGRGRGDREGGGEGEGRGRGEGIRRDILTFYTNEGSEIELRVHTMYTVHVHVNAKTGGRGE